MIFFQNVFIPGFVALKLHKKGKNFKVYSISNSDIDNFVSKWTALYNMFKDTYFFPYLWHREKTLHIRR